MKNIALVSGVLLTAMLTSCGGGGGGSSPAPQQNTPQGTPQSSTTPPSSSTAQPTAAVCVNPKMFSPGERIKYTEVTTYSPSPTGSITTLMDVTVSNDGASASGTISSQSTVNGIMTNASGTITLYHVLDTGLNRILDYGMTEVINGVTIQTKNSPYIINPFGLEVNQSLNQDYVQTSTSSAPPYQATSTVTDTTTFVGMETVTTPAGSFNACKFQEIQNLNQNGGVSQGNITAWYANGLPIKVISTNGGITTTSIITSYSISP